MMMSRTEDVHLVSCAPIEDVHMVGLPGCQSPDCASRYFSSNSLLFRLQHGGYVPVDPLSGRLDG